MIPISDMSRHPAALAEARGNSACLRTGLLDDVMFVGILGKIPVSSVDDYGHNF